jgi:nucleotide-binding universal stress UspA family protein
MFQKLLVPVDLTDTHGRTLEIATELARQSGGTITLLHVIELITGLSPEEGQEFYGRIERSAREHLARLGKLIDDRKVSWQAEVRYGHRAEEVLRHARENENDLIVLTSHRVDLAKPGAGWGTLSYRVGILSACPVLLVK